MQTPAAVQPKNHCLTHDKPIPHQGHFLNGDCCPDCPRCAALDVQEPQEPGEKDSTGLPWAIETFTPELSPEAEAWALAGIEHGSGIPYYCTGPTGDAKTCPAHKDDIRAWRAPQ